MDKAGGPERHNPNLKGIETLKDVDTIDPRREDAPTFWLATWPWWPTLNAGEFIHAMRRRLGPNKSWDLSRYIWNDEHLQMLQIADRIYGMAINGPEVPFVSDGSPDQDRTQRRSDRTRSKAKSQPPVPFQTKTRSTTRSKNAGSTTTDTRSKTSGAQGRSEKGKSRRATEDEEPRASGSMPPKVTRESSKKG